MMDTIQRLLRHPVHVILHWAIHVIMSIYIRLRRWYHEVVGRVVAILRYHHRSPEIVRRDVRGLAKLPRHLSVVLELQGGKGGGGGEGGIKRRRGLGSRGRRRSSGAGEMALEKLANGVAEIAAWCACVGIETLSVYERSGMFSLHSRINQCRKAKLMARCLQTLGVLKSYIPHLHATISRTMHAYFGPPPQTPTFHLRAPHLPSYSPPSSSPPSPPFTPLTNGTTQTRRPTLTILLLSSTDGRPTLVDLTKTLTEMAQRGTMSPYTDISEELIDAEMREIVMEEPDLLILFGCGGRGGGGGADGAELVLQGYPPWQLRLTELL